MMYGEVLRRNKGSEVKIYIYIYIIVAKSQAADSRSWALGSVVTLSCLLLGLHLGAISHLKTQGTDPTWDMITRLGVIGGMGRNGL